MTRFSPTSCTAMEVPLNLSSGEMGIDLSFLQGIFWVFLLHSLDKETQLCNHMKNLYILSKQHLASGNSQEISTDFRY